MRELTVIDCDPPSLFAAVIVDVLEFDIVGLCGSRFQTSLDDDPWFRTNGPSQTCAVSKFLSSVQRRLCDLELVALNLSISWSDKSLSRRIKDCST